MVFEQCLFQQLLAAVVSQFREKTVSPELPVNINELGKQAMGIPLSKLFQFDSIPFLHLVNQTIHNTSPMCITFFPFGIVQNVFSKKFGSVFSKGSIIGNAGSLTILVVCDNIRPPWRKKFFIS